MAEAPDGLEEAKHDLLSRGKGWAEKLEKALKKCRKTFPQAAEWVESL
ncbi:hypothetical protein [Microbulbifer sp.]